MKFVCAECGARIEATKRFFGRDVGCPVCGRMIHVPRPEENTGIATLASTVQEAKASPSAPAPPAASATIPAASGETAAQRPAVRTPAPPTFRSHPPAPKRGAWSIGRVLAVGLALAAIGYGLMRPAHRELPPVAQALVDRAASMPPPIAGLAPQAMVPGVTPEAALEVAPTPPPSPPLAASTPFPKGTPIQPAANTASIPPATAQATPRRKIVSYFGSSVEPGSENDGAQPTPALPQESALPIPVQRLEQQGDLPGNHTLGFDTGAPGVEKSISTWGLDVTWADGGNLRRGIASMGADNVGLVRVGFPITAALVNGDLPPEKIVEIDHMARTAELAGKQAWTLSAATGDGVHAWFKNKNEVIPERWVQVMKAAIRYYRTVHGAKIVSTEPFNEPDFYGWQEGTPQNLREIMRRLRADPDFQGVGIAGPSTLNDDAAIPWYEQIKSFTTEGTTHILAGSLDSYISFYRKVALNHQVLTNPEVHNLAEVIVGADLGLQRAIWWGTAERARGGFVRAQKAGKRLAYADDRPRWTAAAVYRTAGGAIQAFLGGSERTGKDTTYRFECHDRPVFFDGDGPRRAYTVTIKGDTERMVNVAWGPDVPPQIGGRCVLVNRASGKVLEVADASKDDGARLQQATYRGFPHQQWDVAALDAPHGDQSYFTLRAAHSGKAPDDTNFSLEEGSAIRQWGGGENPVEHWYFEYADDGYFLVRNRWSMKCLDVADAGAAEGAEIQQRSPTGKPSQQWRLVPVSDSPLDSTPPAAPTQLTASLKPGSVTLRWSANREADLASYAVLRCSDGRTFDTVARGLTTHEFIDRTADAPLRCRYVVRAVDRSLNQSAPSLPATPTPGM